VKPDPGSFLIKTVREQESKTINDLFEKYLGKDDHVLEIGVGTGYYSMNIALRVRSLIALEPSAAMLNFLKKKITTKGMTLIVVAKKRKNTISKEFDAEARGEC
jgi:ubiquinone/menaquinone biosynthesis C-methylase UbiE